MILFAMAFLVINWNRVSWIFNYQAIFGYASEFFEKPVLINAANENPSPLALESATIAGEISQKANGIEIPKLGLVDIPLVLNEKFTDSEVYRALDRGVVYYPGSALPGENGQTYVLGHSAPPNWPKIKYQWVFSKLEDLLPGDEIFVYYNNRKLTYIVTDTVFVHRGEEIPHPDLTKNHNVLVLISCWPPGKDIHRIAVMAEMK